VLGIYHSLILLWRNIFLVRSDIFLVSVPIFPPPGISATFYSWWREYNYTISCFIPGAGNKNQRSVLRNKILPVVTLTGTTLIP
jgi:hypothetical protein